MVMKQEGQQSELLKKEDKMVKSASSSPPLQTLPKRCRTGEPGAGSALQSRRRELKASEHVKPDPLLQELIRVQPLGFTVEAQKLETS